MPATIPILPNVSLRPACPECSTLMRLVALVPRGDGLEDRTFDCPMCHHVETRSLKLNQ
jgi:hypothetical protein